MKYNQMDAERALLESLGFESDLIDSPSGTRMIRVVFGAEGDEDESLETFAEADRGFACVA